MHCASIKKYRNKRSKNERKEPACFRIFWDGTLSSTSWCFIIRESPISNWFILDNTFFFTELSSVCVPIYSLTAVVKNSSLIIKTAFFQGHQGNSPPFRWNSSLRELAPVEWLHAGQLGVLSAEGDVLELSYRLAGGSLYFHALAKANVELDLSWNGACIHTESSCDRKHLACPEEMKYSKNFVPFRLSLAGLTPRGLHFTYHMSRVMFGNLYHNICSAIEMYNCTHCVAGFKKKCFANRRISH